VIKSGWICEHRQYPGNQTQEERADLVQEALDLALAARLLVLEGVRLATVEVGLAAARHEDAREAGGVPDGEDILERGEADGGEGPVRDGMRHV
jgi:hypothetical protein